MNLLKKKVILSLIHVRGDSYNRSRDVREIICHVTSWCMKIVSSSIKAQVDMDICDTLREFPFNNGVERLKIRHRHYALYAYFPTFIGIIIVVKANAYVSERKVYWETKFSQSVKEKRSRKRLSMSQRTKSHSRDTSS